MSLITYRGRDSNGQPIGPTLYLEFDAITVEELVRTAEITEYPVETGGRLADHYQPLPTELAITGVISDTPVRTPSLREGMADAAPPSTGVRSSYQLPSASAAQRAEGIQGRPIVSLPGERLVRANIERSRLPIPQRANLLHFPEGVTRTTDALRVLENLMDTRLPVRVILHDGSEYDDMMIGRMSAPRAAGRSGSVEISLDMRQVRTANPARVRPTRGEPALSSRRDEGKKNPAPVKCGSVDVSRLKLTEWGLNVTPLPCP